MGKSKVEKKQFLGMEVRVVNGEYMVLKDMFSALGRLREDGQTQTSDRNKVRELADLGIINHGETLTMVVKKGQSEDVSCIKLSDVPLVLTQFKPTKRVGDEALSQWVEFMKFVNEILTKLEVDKFIVTDKQEQLSCQEMLDKLGGKVPQMNTMVCMIMAKLIGVEGRVKKDDLRTYQNQTTVDLLDVHSFVRENFVNAYRFTGSHKESKEMVYEAAMREYPLLDKKIA